LADPNTAPIGSRSGNVRPKPSINRVPAIIIRFELPVWIHSRWPINRSGGRQVRFSNRFGPSKIAQAHGCKTDNKKSLSSSIAHLACLLKTEN
jgi:hypothetical protein